MGRNAWMRGEIASWREAGTIDAATAEALLSRYGERGGIGWAGMLAGGFGALLCGLGTIALFAANWDAFGRGARAAIAVAPMALCGLAAAAGAARGWKGLAFREPLGILWSVAAVAGICLVAQTYNLGGALPDLVLLAAAIVLPAVWATRGVVATAVWPLFAMVWSISAMESGLGSFSFKHPSSLCTGLAIVAASIPAFIAFRRDKSLSHAAVATGCILSGFAYCTGLSFPVCCHIASASPDANLIYSIWVCCAAVGVAGLAFKIPCWPWIATLCTMLAGLPAPFVSSFSSDDGYSLCYPIAIIIATAAIVRSIKLRSIARVNVCALFAAWLVLSKFFASRASFVAKGITLLAFGAALVALNMVLSRVSRANGGEGKEAAK